jgi:hypothetical protein
LLEISYDSGVNSYFDYKRIMMRCEAANDIMGDIIKDFEKEEMANSGKFNQYIDNHCYIKGYSPEYLLQECGDVGYKWFKIGPKAPGPFDKYDFRPGGPGNFVRLLDALDSSEALDN